MFYDFINIKFIYIKNNYLNIIIGNINRDYKWYGNYLLLVGTIKYKKE